MLIRTVFTGNLVVGLFTVNGLHKGVDQVVTYRTMWNLNCNLKTNKVIVFKNGRKLK
jgi:hypothetical protein